MPQILVRNVQKWVLENLKGKAKSNGRSLQAEVQKLLEQAAWPRKKLTMEEFWKRADAIRARTNRAIQTDSTILIREDRDR